MGVIWTNKKRNIQPSDPQQINKFLSTTSSLISVVSVQGGSPVEQPYSLVCKNIDAVVRPNTNNSVLQYNGTSAYTRYPRTIFGNLSRGTAIIRFKMASFGTQVIWYEAAGGFNQFALYAPASTSSVASFNIGSNTSRDTTKASWNLGQWYTLAVTWGDEIKIYVDGVLDNTIAVSGGTGAPIGTADVFTCIGAYELSSASHGFYFDGQVGICEVYSKTLLSGEIRSRFLYPWQIFSPERRPLFFNTAGGGSTVTGVGSSAGVGTVSGVGASTSAQVGSSAGVGSASGVGASTANSVGSSTGTGAASGVGSSTGGSDGVGSSTGTGTATGVGASTAASVGSISGVGTASGIGASTAASTGSANGTGTATGVGENGSVTVSGVGSASGTGTATGIAPSHGGGNGTGRNLSRKQKKKLKAVESQEWLKAEETARQLLNDRFTKQTPQEKAEALQTYVESLQPVIEALKALTTQVEEVAEVVEEIPVVELTPHQEILSRFDTLEKKLKSVEELVIILMADL